MKESMKQLFHLCSTWQQHHWKRCIRVTFSVQSHWAASSAFSQTVKLPWQHSEQSGWGIAERNVQWWSGRKLQKESIQWVPTLHEKRFYKSGRWPDPNNNLLRACLPRHNALQSKVQLSNMATILLNPFFFFSSQPLSQPSSAVNRTSLVLFLLTLSIFLYHWHEIGMLFYGVLEARIFCNATRAKCFILKGDIHLLKNVTPILTWSN